MLQNLNPDLKKEKSWKKWNRELNKLYPQEKPHKVLGYNRFHKYIPTGEEYVKDTLTSFTGVYVMEPGYGACSPLGDIKLCTKSYSNGYNIMYGLCDNASQVIQFYNENKWSGNHVIILHKMTNFRWHKWGPYIGEYIPKHTYFSDEEGISQIYSFEIFKVR